MQNYDFDFQLDDFMLYCRTNQLRPKTMASYEQTLRLFQRWLKEELQIENVNEVTEPIRGTQAPHRWKWKYNHRCC